MCVYMYSEVCAIIDTDKDKSANALWNGIGF